MRNWYSQGWLLATMSVCIWCLIFVWDYAGTTKDKIAFSITWLSFVGLAGCYFYILGGAVMNALDRRRAARYWIRECINNRITSNIPYHVLEYLRRSSKDKKREYVGGCINNVRKLYEPHEPTLPQILDAMTVNQRKLIIICIMWPDMFGDHVGFHDAVLLYLMGATDPEPLAVERWAKRIQSQMAGSARAAQS